MPDVHVPHLEGDDDRAGQLPQAAPSDEGVPSASHPVPHSKSWLKIGLEVVLISIGVSLGLAGEQWREHARHRELAEASLRRFRSEFRANRLSVADVKDKHVETLKEMRAYFAASAAERQKLLVPRTPLNPAFFEHAAWDLALATQSLADVDSDLAFAIAHVYAAQQQLDELTRAITQSMYSTDIATFIGGVRTYFADCVLLEPRLLALYDEILPRLNRALGEPPAP